MEYSQPQVEISDRTLDEEATGTLPAPGEASPPADGQKTPRHWDGKHFVNVRLSIPLIFMRVYVTLVAGKERRCKTRRRAEREKHPLVTLGNSFFFSTASAVFSLAFLAVVIVATVLVIRQLFSVEITVR